MKLAKKPRKKLIYMDYASTSPVDPKVEAAMRPFWQRSFGNPSALHRLGVEAKNAVADARRKIASVFFAQPDEIIFTSGGTESDNLAIMGVVQTAKKTIQKPHIITTAIEHSAILETCRSLEVWGAEVTYLPVSPSGIVDPKQVKEALKKNTVLVSVMYANNEIGTVQPIVEIAKEIRHFKKNKTSHPHYPYFHTDATQAVNYLPINIAKLGVDLLSCNASKIYGPKGIGALYKKRYVQLAEITFGGSQEYGLRAGTENVPLIVGFAQAMEIAEKMKIKESARLAKLRDYFFSMISKNFPDAVINGDKLERLPNNINISFPGYESDFLVIELDARDILVSGKSACKSGDGEISYVINAIRPDADETEGSVRFSLGRTTTKQDVDYAVASLKEVFKKQERWKNKNVN